MSPDGYASPDAALAAAGATVVGISVRQEQKAPPADRRASRFKVLTLAECAAAEPRGYIVKGLIAPGDLSVLFGPPGAGKSVVAPYLAHAVAIGRPAFGRRVRQGVVLYVAAEDGSGMRLRAAALRAAHGDTGAFRVVADPVDLMGDGITDSPHLAELRGIAQRIGAKLIVLDTLAAAFPGLDENDGRSMGRVVRVLRQLGAPAEATSAAPAWHGAAVVAVHHAAKGGGTTPRGHGVLDGAADVTLRIDVPEDRAAPRTVKLGKNRNGSSLEGFAFTIRAEALGTDEDGDAITAPVAEEAEAEPPRASKPLPRLADGHALMLRALESLGAEGAGEMMKPEPGMPVVRAIPRPLLRARLVREGWFAEPELLPDQLPNGGVLTNAGYRRENKSLEALKRKGLAGFSRSHVWTA